jgi:hypothetical protein
MEDAEPEEKEEEEKKVRLTAADVEVGLAQLAASPVFVVQAHAIP